MSTSITRTRAGGDAAAAAPSPLNVALAMSGGSGGGDGAAVAVEGTATISNEVFNLIKGIIGAGVLSLPAGKRECRCCYYHFVIVRLYEYNI